MLLEEKTDSPGPLLLFEGTGVTWQGNEPMRLHEAPTWIGAIAAITEDPVPVRVTAKSVCRVAILPREEFIALACKHPSVHREGDARDRAGDARHQRARVHAASG